MAPPDAISFGPFQLRPAAQLLQQGDRRLEIGSRALDLLLALVERPGELVTKDELVARAWPDTNVDESNLRAQMAALRRVLGDGRRGARYIVTVPGRGYRFVAAVAGSGGVDRPAPAQKSGLPQRLTPPIGRAELIGVLAARVRRRRFVTVVGPGGIGKTTVALAAAEVLASSYEHGVCFVDLGPVADPALVMGALSLALGLGPAVADPIAHLGDKHMLVVLDSCEHVIEQAALVAERVLKSAPGTHVLATSREPLRAEGERVQRLDPLEVPPISSALSAAEALEYSAVELFVERAAACLGDYELCDADAPIVAEICRKLDGIALAIELVAGRADAFGIRGLAEQLDDRMRLLTRGRRTALARHQTLRAALDWSYEYLDEPARAVLRRLAVFAGGFVMTSAATVAAEGAIAAEDIPELVADLVAKSLIVADAREQPVVYRLLDTTRAYALAKLAETGERRCAMERHARHYIAHLETPAEGGAGRATELCWLDNLRAALEWAFSPDGNAELGAALTAAAVPVWVRNSMMDECRTRVESALARVDPSRSENARLCMELSGAYAAALIGASVPASKLRAAWQRALSFAEQLADPEYQLRALWGLWHSHLSDADFRGARAAAERFAQLADASRDPTNRAVADRLLGGALYLLGDREGAREHLERMLAGYTEPVRAAMARFVLDQNLVARGLLSIVDWEQGRVDRAVRVSRGLLDEALARDHAVTICNVLSDSACPIALLTGDLVRAEALAGLLRKQATAHALEIWTAWVDCFETQIRLHRDPPSADATALRERLAPLTRDAVHPRYYSVITDLALGLGRAGDAAAALGHIDAALGVASSRSEHWLLAEFLRARAELLLLRDGREAAPQAEATLLRAVATAQRQRALSWELRAATSLARLRLEVRRRADARAALAPVYARFREGLDTGDLVAARALLDRLA